MAEIPSIPTDIGVEELLSEKIPEITKTALTQSNAAADLSGTEISMMIDTGTVSVSYTLKDGKDIDVSQGVNDNAMLKLNVDHSDLEKMIKSNNLDMLLGLQSDISKSKYDALKSLKGSFIAEIDDDGDKIKMQVVLNGAATPQSVFKMTMKDSTALIKKETNPVQLFMSGALKIEGDMAFAMAAQPLFT